MGTDEIKFKIAPENRQIEIDRYWSRTGYFILFIGVLATGYFSGNNDDVFLKWILSSLMPIISFIWYLTTRGAKYWQENWEKLTEKYDTTGIYDEHPIENGDFTSLLSARRYSVSRANTWIALVVFLYSTALFIYQSILLLPCSYLAALKCLIMRHQNICAMMLFIATAMIIIKSETYLKKYEREKNITKICLFSIPIITIIRK